MSTMSGSRSVIGPLDGVMVHPDRRNLDLIERKYKEVDEHGRLPHPWLTEKAQTDTDALAFVGVHSVWLNLQALTARDNKGEAPIDIARRSGACAEIIGLLSHTPEEVRSLGGQKMLRLYAPVGYWRNEMVKWINSRSYADCHKFINEHDDEMVREKFKCRYSKSIRLPCSATSVRPPRRKLVHCAKPATFAAPSAKSRRGRSTRRRVNPQQPLQPPRQTSAPSTRAYSSSTGASRSLEQETDPQV